MGSQELERGRTLGLETYFGVDTTMIGTYSHCDNLEKILMLALDRTTKSPSVDAKTCD